MPVIHTILQRFIVLEGLDGSGTSTQMELLAARLAREGRPHWLTCEPTDGPIGRLIRDILRREVNALPRTLARLFAADRNEHVGAPLIGIAARAARGELVVCDRYLFSSLAYQSIECGFDFVRDLNLGFPLPECMIFLDTPVSVCQERVSRRSLPELFDGHEYQTRVREAYLSAIEVFRGMGMRIETLDGDRPAELIEREIWEIIAGFRK